jgi:tetratricopeptide (TPR) repeat protein
LNRRIDALIARALAANAHWTIENNGGGVHGFDVLDDNEVSREIMRRTLAFIKAVTRPEISRAYASLGDDAALGAVFAREEWPKAVEGYRSRVAEAPADAEAHRRLGLSLMGLSQHADALQALERAWELGRRGAMDTAYPAARAAARAGNVDRAVHWLGVMLATPFGPSLDEIRASADFASIREAPAFRDLLTSVEEHRSVIAMIASGRAAEALKAITSAKSGALTREDVLNDLGYRLLTAGKANEAVQVFRHAVTRYPRSANAWDSLSEAAEAAGAKKDAVRYAQKALELVSRDASLSEAARENIRRASTGRVGRLTAAPRS